MADDRALRFPSLAPSPTLLVVAVSALAYVATAARSVLGGDNGELTTLMVTGGAAHPPGYPLYVLYLRAFRWLPASSPAHAAALATVLLAVLSIAALQRASLAWNASRGATAIATTVYAFSALAWELGTHAEVFALNALLASLILWAAAPSSPLRGTKLTIVLSLLAGLGLANHQTIIALAPVGLWGALRGVAQSRSRLLAIALGILALLIGLSPYAYVWSCAQRSADLSRWTWGGVHDLPSFYAYFRRGQYPDAELSSIEHITALLWRVTTELAGLPLFALLAAFFWMGRSYREPPTPALLARVLPIVALVACFGLAGPAFALIFNLPLHGIGHAVTERFYLLPMIVLTILGARSLDTLLGPIFERPAVALSATASLIAGSAYLSLPHVRAHHRPYVEQYVTNALRSAPPNAVLMGSGDHRFGAFLYARYALGLRKDVVFVSPRLLLAPWYHQRISSELALPLVAPVDRTLDVNALAAQLLFDSKRPLCLTNSFLPQAIEAKFPTYARGTLLYVVPRVTDAPAPLALEADNLALFATFAREIDPPPRGTDWIFDLARDYQRPWLALEDAFTHLHDEPHAAANRMRANEYAPPPLDSEATP